MTWLGPRCISVTCRVVSCIASWQYLPRRQHVNIFQPKYIFVILGYHDQHSSQRSFWSKSFLQWMALRNKCTNEIYTFIQLCTYFFSLNFSLFLSRFNCNAQSQRKQQQLKFLTDSLFVVLPLWRYTWSDS